MYPDKGNVMGWLWRLPVVKPKALGRLGPGVGCGAGCGVGIGVGLLGGYGLGVGIPGLPLRIGVGAGCGIGVGIGYGLGRGVAYDENQKYSNVGKIFHGTGDLPSHNEISALMDKTIALTERMIELTSREIGKWGR